MTIAAPTGPAHDWRGQIPADRPHYPAALRGLRAAVLLLLALLVLGSAAFHRQALDARQATANATAQEAAAHEQSTQAEAMLAAAAAREARANRLAAWLRTHPPLQPLVLALFGPLARDDLRVSELTCRWEQPDTPASLRVAFRAPVATGREVLAVLPEAAQAAGWRLVPIRQEQDPATGETLLQAALAPLAP